MTDDSHPQDRSDPHHARLHHRLRVREPLPRRISHTAIESQREDAAGTGWRKKEFGLADVILLLPQSRELVDCLKGDEAFRKASAENVGLKVEKYEMGDRLAEKYHGISPTEEKPWNAILPRGQHVHLEEADLHQWRARVAVTYQSDSQCHQAAAEAVHRSGLTEKLSEVSSFQASPIADVIRILADAAADELILTDASFNPKGRHSPRDPGSRSR